MKGANDCTRLLKGSSEEALAAEGVAKKSVRAENVFSFSRAVPSRKCFGGCAETDDDGLVAGSVLQPIRCSETSRASCSCSARVRYRKKSTGESDRVGEEGKVVE